MEEHNWIHIAFNVLFTTHARSEKNKSNMSTVRGTHFQSMCKSKIIMRIIKAAHGRGKDPAKHSTNNNFKFHTQKKTKKQSFFF